MTNGLFLERLLMFWIAWQFGRRCIRAFRQGLRESANKKPEDDA
jgi:hypothetical protein